MNNWTASLIKKQNLHLSISVLVVIPIALAYGIHPRLVLPQFFDFKVETIDLANVFRAIMGMYLAMAFLWIAGIFKPNYWLAATLSNVMFMGGLAAGRIVSLLFDGIPSPTFLVGTVGELTLTVFGIYHLIRFNKNSKQ